MVSATAESTVAGKPVKWLLWSSTAAFLTTLIVIPNFIKAGGVDITPALLVTTVGCAGVSVAAFLYCPWRHPFTKAITLFFMLPALSFGVDLAIIIVGRWFGLGFGHC